MGRGHRAGDLIDRCKWRVTGASKKGPYIGKKRAVGHGGATAAVSDGVGQYTLVGYMRDFSLDDSAARISVRVYGATVDETYVPFARTINHVFNRFFRE